MKIGILECDEPLPHLRREFGTFSQMIAEPFASVRAGWAFPVYNLLRNQFPRELGDCDGYITTGSRYSVYDDLPWIRELETLTREADAREWPFFGICFGHQMIANALGGRVARSEKGWGVGVSVVDVQSERARSLGLASWPDPTRLVVSHQDQVLDLPDETEVLGGNPFCPNSMILRRRTMLGIQGHPEYLKAYSDALMRERRERIGEPVFSRGQSSLKIPTDADAVFEAIARFFESTVS